ncbi:MAG: glycine cleavage system aminomethyltransferase GcvT [Candidatus Micrarchaeia archaeon]
MKKTPLNSLHKSLGAKMIEFGGWEMPVQYAGIIEEHNAVRNACGIFDVSHMGEIFVRGANAFGFVQKIITNSLSKIGVGRAIYSPICNENGGIIDDVIVYWKAEGEFLFVVNAANTEKDYAWLIKNADRNVEIENATDRIALLAVQGPKSQEILQKITKENLSAIPYFHSKECELGGKHTLLSRTGYTGEDGFEVFVDSPFAVEMWNEILEAGKDNGIMPAGLGARDTLRLEAGLMLYGNDMDDNTTPLEVPLKWTVSFDKEFIGKEALLSKAPSKKLSGFELLGKGVPRHGNEVFDADGNKIGVVTSGIFSPTLKKPIGFCFIPPEWESEKNVYVQIHGRLAEAKLCSTRFYKRGR